ncbi:Nn.00g060340.m01.CDS01 [Neocucurbitaria sp. VM-36]
MALQLRISNTRERRPDFKGNTRRLLRLSEVPDPPTSLGAVCEALESNGRPCNVALPKNAKDPWCNGHHKKWIDLTSRWNKIHKEAEQLVVTSLDVAKQKVLKLRQSVEHRRQIRDTFYPRGGDLQDYIKWIGKLENDVRQLADTLLMQNLNRGPTPETPGVHTATPHPDKANIGEKIMILQSPLDPRIPINSLEGMPDDGTILILKHFYLDLCADSIRRLYYIVPDLNDSPKGPGSPRIKDQPTADHGTDIVRAWFRIMVLNDSEAAILEHATRSRSIHDFLMGCQASQLEMYCDYFEKAWRPHAVQYLRVAICAQTLAGGDIKTIQLLGGTIPSTTEGLKMTKPCWDILYRWFPTLFTPRTLASICSNFEDYTTICKLLMLRLYNDHWYDPASILSECTTGVYMGFIPTSKGDFTTSSGLRQEGQLWVQRQSRNYLCGQMAIGHPLTQAFLDELRRRTSRLYLVVYEGTHADATVHPTEPDLFISRHRSSMSLDGLDQVNFSTTLTLEDVKNQLRMRKTSMYDPIVVDSWQFIIIDREFGLPFQLIDIVQDTLLMLVGDPSPRQMAKRVIREVIPPSVQEIFLEEIHIESSAHLRYSAPLEVQYEGNRQRCYDPDRSVLAAQQNKMMSQQMSRDGNRFIRRVVEDMERCGIVSLAPEYEEWQTRPVAIQGSDGALDLYFPYGHGDLSVEGERAPSLPLPATTCLVDFAQSYKQKHANAIMAKGSIQTHYCAWPMPAIKSLGRSGLNFATWEGHVYRWNAMPFDRPSSANAWQYYIQHFLNSKYPFVMFYLTTFVICATDKEDADRKTTILLDEMEDRGWRISLPRTYDWTQDIDELKLETLFSGIRPA